MFPFTLILHNQVDSNLVKLPELSLKLDPGSKNTGIAIINQTNGDVVFGAELEHRSQTIIAGLLRRKSLRRTRRNRKTRYKKARFNNRTRPDGWLPPSVKSRLANSITWVRKLIKFFPISALAVENVRFDLQKLENPEIQGVEYQQGTLFGYEIREYLLIKFNHTCVYASKSKCSERLEIEHINPKSRGGSNKASNLTIACDKHNREKGNQTALDFGFPNVQAQAKESLRDATAVNITRFALVNGVKTV